VHKEIRRYNLKCTVGFRSSSAMTQTVWKSPNIRAKSRTVARKSSTGGNYVCAGELDIVKITNLDDL